MEREKNGRLVVILALIFTIPPLVEAETRYNVIDLDPLGKSGSTAISINNSNQIVGHVVNVMGQPKATLFDSSGNGNNICLTPLGGDWDWSVARSINNLGQIVGSAYNGGSIPHATIFDATDAGHNIDLATPTGPYSDAISINDAGQIVGSAWYGTPPTQYATIFDATGAGHNIGLSDRYSIILGNNNIGQIVGSCSFPYGERATLFSSGNLDLGTLGGATSRAYSINDNGQIVGYARASFPLNNYATLFDATGMGHNINLDSLRPTGWSAAYSINNLGQVVGIIEESQTTSAALFDITGNGNTLTLDSLIDPTSGWHLTNASAINDNGWIVGEGIRNGCRHAVLLTPVPEPATLFLLGVGGLVLRRKELH